MVLIGAARAVSKPFFDAALMTVIEHQKQAIESAHFENTELGLNLSKNGSKVLGRRSARLVLTRTRYLSSKTRASITVYFGHFVIKLGLQIHIGNTAHINRTADAVELWYSQR